MQRVCDAASLLAIGPTGSTAEYVAAGNWIRANIRDGRVLTDYIAVADRIPDRVRRGRMWRQEARAAGLDRCALADRLEAMPSSEVASTDAGVAPSPSTALAEGTAASVRPPDAAGAAVATATAERLRGVTAALRAAMPAIRHCYEQALRQTPTLAGHLVVRFGVDASGHVPNMPEVTGMPTAPQIGVCIAARVHSITFPAGAPETTEYSFPFDFTPGG
jgi:hypothetical protein